MIEYINPKRVVTEPTIFINEAPFAKKVINIKQGIELRIAITDYFRGQEGQERIVSLCSIEPWDKLDCAVRQMIADYKNQ